MRSQHLSQHISLAVLEKNRRIIKPLSFQGLPYEDNTHLEGYCQLTVELIGYAPIHLHLP